MILYVPLEKAKALPEGTVRDWRGGKHKKVGGKWVPVTGKPAEERVYDSEEKAQERYIDAVENHGIMSLAIVEVLEDEFKIYDFDSLKQYLQDNPRDAAHKIYRKVFDVNKKSLAEMGVGDYEEARGAWDVLGDRERSMVGSFGAAMKALGDSLIALRDLYSQPKQRLMVKVPGKQKKVVKQDEEGKKREYKYEHTYRYEEEEDQPAWKPSALKAAGEKTGGWTNMAKLPTTDQMRSMIKKKTATVKRGKFDPDKPFEVKQGERYMVVPFRETEEGVTVTLEQREKRKGKRGGRKKRDVVTAEIEVKLPYEFAHQFLDSHAKAKRGRNAVRQLMQRSKGYQRVRSERAA